MSQGEKDPVAQPSLDGAGTKKPQPRKKKPRAKTAAQSSAHTLDLTVGGADAPIALEPLETPGATIDAAEPALQPAVEVPEPAGEVSEPDEAADEVPEPDEAAAEVPEPDEAAEENAEPIIADGGQAPATDFAPHEFTQDPLDIRAIAPEPPAAPAGQFTVSHSPALAVPQRSESDVVDPANAALVATGLVKHFGGQRAVDGIDLTVPAGSFYGIVGPNGAGKTTTLSMIAGLLKPDGGSITVAGIDARKNPRAAKKVIGVLPDRLRTFDRLTGRQLLTYFGALRGLSGRDIESRVNDLAQAFDLTGALGRVVSDYSAGMTKKVMLAGALIHSPRLLILDEPFESVDPVSSSIILDILSAYVQGGGTVILSSHGMDLVERVCTRLAVIVTGHVLAEGTVEHVRGGVTLEQRFVELSGGVSDVEGLEWLHTYSA